MSVLVLLANNVDFSVPDIGQYTGYIIVFLVGIIIGMIVRGR